MNLSKKNIVRCHSELFYTFLYDIIIIIIIPFLADFINCAQFHHKLYSEVSVRFNLPKWLYLQIFVRWKFNQIKEKWMWLVLLYTPLIFTSTFVRFGRRVFCFPSIVFTTHPDAQTSGLNSVETTYMGIIKRARALNRV